MPTTPALFAPFLELGRSWSASLACSEQEMTYCSEIMWNIMFPLHSWKASCPGSPIAVGNSRCQNVSAPAKQRRPFRRGDPGVLRWEGIPLETWGKTSTSHSAVSRKTHLRPLNTTGGDLLFEAHVISTSECIWSHEARVVNIRTIKENIVRCSRWNETGPYTYRTTHQKPLSWNQFINPKGYNKKKTSKTTSILQPVTASTRAALMSNLTTPARHDEDLALVRGWDPYWSL